VKYLEKADTILKNITESNKIDDAGNKYSENSNTAVVVISGNEGQLGIIVHTNNLLKAMLGYTRAELTDRNVAAIMPKIYADTHHAVLSRYIAAS
jgi:PAS domain S-box-containing protein